MKRSDIGLANEVGSAQWEAFTYTRDGNPTDIRVPTASGDYLIGYFSGQDQTAIKSRPLTVTAPQAQLIAEPSAPAGTEILVSWDGPNYQGDYIGIGMMDSAGDHHVDYYDYTSSANPVTLVLPETPGQYVIRYYVDLDSYPIGEIPFTIE